MKRTILLFILFLITSCDKEYCECGRVLYETATQIQTSPGNYEQVIHAQIQNLCSDNVKTFQMPESEWFANVQRTGPYPYLQGTHGRSVYCNTTTW
jgi:hypothetical protein